MSPNDLTRLIDERLRDTISAADFAQLEDEFRRSAEYALQKNADLYRRLA